MRLASGRSIQAGAVIQRGGRNVEADAFQHEVAVPIACGGHDPSGPRSTRCMQIQAVRITRTFRTLGIFGQTFFPGLHLVAGRENFDRQNPFGDFYRAAGNGENATPGLGMQKFCSFSTRGTTLGAIDTRLPGAVFGKVIADKLANLALHRRMGAVRGGHRHRDTINELPSRLVGCVRPQSSVRPGLAPTDKSGAVGMQQKGIIIPV